MPSEPLCFAGYGPGGAAGAGAKAGYPTGTGKGPAKGGRMTLAPGLQGSGAGYDLSRNQVNPPCTQIRV